MSRVAVVTGASSGIGAAIASKFIEGGVEVVGLDLVPPDTGQEQFRHVSCDVSSHSSVQAAFATIDHADVLVLNAGVQGVGLVGEQSVEEWTRVVGVNLHGAYHCLTEGVPKLRDGGAIVAISSAAAFLGLPGRAAYCASKAGLLALVRVLAVELAPRGIRANAICPGYTRTPLVERAIGDGWLDAGWMTQRVPLNRLARPEEIAAVVNFVAGKESSYLTGSEIVVDGGWTVQGIGHAPDWLTNAEVVTS